MEHSDQKKFRATATENKLKAKQKKRVECSLADTFTHDPSTYESADKGIIASKNSMMLVNK